MHLLTLQVSDCVDALQKKAGKLFLENLAYPCIIGRKLKFKLKSIFINAINNDREYFDVVKHTCEVGEIR